jgi:hypothetical protein
MAAIEALFNIREGFHGPILKAQSTGQFGSLVELMTSVDLPCSRFDGMLSV